LFTEVETLKGHLRYAQSRGMGDSVSWGASLTSNTYVLQRNGATASTIWPGENSATHTLPGGVTITTGAGTSITFDSWGSPGSSDIALTLSAGGESQSITITGETGFIP